MKSAKRGRSSRDVIVEGQLENVKLSFVVDTGPDVTIVRPDVYNAISEELKPKLQKSSVQVGMANGQPLGYDGFATFSLIIKEKLDPVRSMGSGHRD